MCAIDLSSDIHIPDRKNNPFRVGAMGAAAGAIVGGGIGYCTTKLVKNGIPTDQFVHSVTKEYYFDKAKINSLLREVGLDIKFDKIKDLLNRPNLTPEELKSFLEKNKKFFKKEFEGFTNGKAEEVTSKINNVIVKYNKNFNCIKEQLTKSYDVAKGKFNFSNMNPNLGVISEAVEKVLKIGRTVKYGAVGAFTLGTVAFIAKVKDNREKNKISKPKLNA